MRLFVAIELEDALKRSLFAMIDGLSEFRRDVRWVKAEQMHLTVKFLGEVASEDLGQVQDACGQSAAGCGPFTLAIDGAGCFGPRGKVRVIWGGMKSPPPELLDYAAGCEDALAELGFEREQRPFSAHMTIGRVRDDRSGGRLREAVETLRTRETSQNVDTITLFQSELRPEGARYTVLGRYPFGQADDEANR